jgi:hypothetical protein
LNFNNCQALKQLLLTGSSVSSVVLPVSGALEELRLPPTVKDLIIESHTGLTKDGFSIGGYNYGSDNIIGGIGGSYINDYSQLETVKIINTPIDTYDMIKNAVSLTHYRLEGIDWEITTPDTQYLFYCKVEDLPADNTKKLFIYNPSTKDYSEWDGTKTESLSLYEELNMINDENEIVAIPVLDYLLKKTPDDGLAHADALKGHITINIEAKANELALYEKYHNLYPNVEIEYGDKVDLVDAYRIRFYSVDIANLAADTDITKMSPYFTALTDGSKTLQELTAANTGFTNPLKAMTSTEVFEFSGTWTDWNTKIEYYEVGFAGIVPDSDLYLVPSFNSSVRVYQINLYDYDRTNLTPDLTGTF